MKFPKLEWLSLDNNQLSKEGLEALASNPHLAGLRYLDLGRNWIKSDWLAPLFSSPHMAGLKTLLFYSNSIKEDGMDAFSHATMSGLEVLDLSSNYLHPEGAAKLASVSCFPELMSLNLAGSWVKSEGAIAFGKTEHFPKLKHLYVGRNLEAYSPEAMQAWLDFCAKRGAETLDFSFAKLPEGAAEQIAHCEGLSSLRTLVLSGCSIGDEGAQSLAKASHLEGLDVLELSHNGISEDCEALVREAPQFQNTDVRIE